MKIEYLKTTLSNVGASTIEEVYFDRNHIVNTTQKKQYPYVFWDLNSFRSVMNWRDTAQEKESVQMTAYCIGYLDKDVAGATVTKEQMYDTLRDAFRGYLTVLMADAYTKITNMHAMPNELYDFGLTVDAEIGVSFNVSFVLYCNVEVPGD